MKALVNCDIYTGSNIHHDSAVLIDGDRIAGIVKNGEVPHDAEVLDCQGKCVAPGFIDLQVNGGGGVLINDDYTEDAIDAVFQAHVRYGTTSMLPTFITGEASKMAAFARSIENMVEARHPGVIGLHLEGPFLNPNKAGVHDKAYIREPSEEDFGIIEDVCVQTKLITVAPECIDQGVIARLTRHGWKVSAGHTNATFQELLQAEEEGLTKVTHLHNAMSPFTSREPGAVGFAFDRPEIFSGIIVDGMHVHPASVRISCASKKPGHVLLVTDAMPPVGTEIGSFMLGDLEIFVRNGKCQTADGTLGGSALDMASAVRNCVQHVGIPKDEALRMASTYPAAYLGLEGELGRIEAGYRANLVIFNNEIWVTDVIINGNHRDFS